MTANDFINSKLGDKNYTHSKYPMHREEIAEWLDEYLTSHKLTAIQAGVDISAAGKKLGHVFSNMIVGDSFLFCVEKDDTAQKRAWARCSYYSKSVDDEVKFKTGKTDVGIRVWRTV